MDDYWWRTTGGPEQAAPARFPTQADAEAWLGETWEDLAAAGVEAVTLMSFEEPVYGPMPLGG